MGLGFGGCPQWTKSSEVNGLRAFSRGVAGGGRAGHGFVRQQQVWEGVGLATPGSPGCVPLHLLGRKRHIPNQQASGRTRWCERPLLQRICVRVCAHTWVCACVCGCMRARTHAHKSALCPREPDRKHVAARAIDPILTPCSNPHSTPQQQLACSVTWPGGGGSSTAASSGESRPTSTSGLGLSAPPPPPPPAPPAVAAAPAAASSARRRAMTRESTSGPTCRCEAHSKVALAHK